MGVEESTLASSSTVMTSLGGFGGWNFRIYKADKQAQKVSMVWWVEKKKPNRQHAPQ